MHKSSTQPLCRYCAKPIKKHSITVYVKLESERSENHREHPGFSRYLYVPSPIKSKADCQKLTNHAVISVRWHRDNGTSASNYERQPENDHIDLFTEWDGESYADDHFCNGDHARSFAYSLAEHTKFAMPEWHEAMAKRTKGAA